MASQGLGISVPISLLISNLLSVVNMLLSKLSNLKVGTSGFKSLLNVITTILKDIDKLTTLTDKPFISANLFTAADRTVNKLEEDLDRVQIAASRIKFSDLELDPSLTAELKAFETLIESIKNSLKTVKETAKQAFLDSDVGKSWAENHKDAATLTLLLLTTTITKEVLKLKTELDQAKDAISDYQHAILVSKNINNFMSKRSGHELSEAAMGKELFDKIFKTDEAGEVVKFLNGGKTLLLQWLQQLFNLDSATVLKLTEGAGAAVVKAFSEIGGKVEAALKALQIKLRNAATELKTTTNNGSTLEAAVKEKTEKFNQAEAALAQMVASNTSVSTSEALLRAELEQTKAQLAEYKERLAEAVRTNPDWVNSNKLANAALELLKSTLSQTNAQFLQQLRVMHSFNSMKMAVINFMGFNLVLNLTRRAVSEAINHIRELDTVMNGIAIVTDMSTGDLWNLIDQYSKMAQVYGVSITGAYEVSQIYYQQGLETADVMTLTNETLKLAKISGLDYATTTDYMTTAIRGFKMEMSDASTVVDVYSNLAAHTAVSLEELAVAMSKTASSMEGVGATFEEASAMIATMVAVTRESATNIGSAMKSIASRYGELTKDPTKLVDEEGEAMAFNKVDTALQSVGISMRTVDGQFREFTDVIVELGEKWEQLDSTQQRYIATLFAGNRQLSRFLALVSNIDLLKSNLDVARNSEDTGTLQALKALDSILSKTELVRVAYQQFYTTIGVEDVWKGFLDGAKNVINTLNGLPKLFGKLPISAINAVGSIIVVIKNLGLSLLSTVAKNIGNSLATGFLLAIPSAKTGAENWFNTAVNTIKGKTSEALAAGQAVGNALNKGLEGTRGLTAWGANNITKGLANNWSLTAKFASSSYATKEESQKAWGSLADQMKNAGVLTDEGFNIIKAGGLGALDIIERIRIAVLGEGNAAEESKGKLASWSAAHQKGLSSLQAFGSALNLVATAIDTSTTGGKLLSGTFMALSGVIVTTTALIKAAGAEANAIPWVAIASGAVSAISGIMTIVKSFSLEALLEEATKKAEELTNKAKELKSNYRILESSVKKYEELKEARYDSAEAAEEYLTAVEDLADKFPELISSFDASGNAVLEATNMEATLTKARLAAAEAAYNAAIQEREKAKLELQNKLQSLTEKLQNVGTYWSRSSVSNKKGPKQQHVALGTAIDSNGNATALIRDNNIDAFPVKETLLTLKEQNKLNIYTELLYNRLEEYLGSAYLLIHSLFNDIDHGDINTAQLSIILMRTLFDTMGWTLTKDFESLLTSLTNMLSEVAPLENSIEIANKTAVDSWIKKSDAYNKTPFIRDNSSLLTILENRLYNLAKEADDFSEGKLVNLGSPLISSLTTLWSNLNDLTLKQVDNIINNSENYTSQDLKTILGNTASLALEWLYDIFDLLTKNIQTNLRNKLNLVFDEKSRDNDAYNTVLDFINDTNQEFTLNEQKFLISILDLIDNINQSGFSANGLASASTKLLSQISGLTTDARNALLNTILTNGFSVEGWKKTLEYITNNTDFNFSSIETSNIDTIIHDTIPNYLLAATSIVGQIEKDWTDIDKFFSSLSKGVNKTEVDSLLNLALSLGITELLETDFVSNGEDMIVNATKIEALMNDKKESLKLLIDNLITDLNDTYHTLQDMPFDLITQIDGDNLINLEIIDADLLKQYQRILGSDFDKYFKQDEEGVLEAILQEGETLEEADTRIWNAVYLHYQNNLSALLGVNSYYDILFNNLSKSLKWKHGDYSSLLDTKLYASVTDVETRLLELASDIDELSEDELKWPDVKAARDQVREAYDKLISDIFDKGIKNIKLSDYEGIIGISLENITGTYENFILTYAKYANYSTKEMNEVLLKAIEKDNALKSLDILKDFQYESKDRATTSLSALSEYASRVGASLNDIINTAVISANATLDEYVVDMTALSALGNKLEIDAEELQAATLDSINSYWDNIVKLIQSGLNGQLSNADWQSLRRFSPDLAENGYTAGLEGLQLTDESFLTLYGTVSKTNKLLAKSLLPDLIKTSGRYRTLGDVLREFEETTDKARKDMLKDIASSMLREPDRYNLMGADLPTTWQIADNFYGSAYKGNEVIKGMLKGKVSASDFSAFMQSILDNTQNAEDRQWALEQLLNAPDYFFEENGTLMVNTALMGLTKYQQYYDIMVRAYDVVRKAGAKEQEIYNALYYGSESLLNADIYNEDGTVNSQKLINLVDGKTKLGENIKAALEKILIGNKSLYEMLKSGDKDTAKMILILAETNWDYENLDTQLEEYFSHYGGGTITIDDVTGKIIFKASDGDKVTTTYKVGDKDLTREEYSKWLAARAKAGIKDTDITEENAANDITYTIGGQKITVSIDSTCKVQYKATLPDGGPTVEASSEADLLAALRAVGWAESTEESGESTPKTRTIKIDNIEYIIDADGKVTLGSNIEETEDIQNTIKNLEQELLPEPLKVETPVEGEVSNLNLKLAEGAAIHLITDEEALKLSEILASVDGDLSRLMLTPKDVFALINETVPKLSGTLSDAEYNHVMTALIKALQLSWAEDANNEPDLTPLDLKTEVEAPELVVKQKVRLDIETDDDPYIALNRILNGRPANEYAEAVEKYSTVTYSPQTDRFTYVSNGAIEFSKIIPPAGWEYDPSTDTFTTTAEVYVPLEYTEVPEELEEPKVGIEVIDIPPEDLDAVVENATENIDKIGLETDLSKVTAQINDYKVPKKEMIIEPRFRGLVFGVTSATGTFNALASGRQQTLMGELGPELYVQNGHYYIAGLTGPEMISLADDAIVFNHLLTERLLKNGKTYGHGKPVTNEYRAAGMAKAKVASELYNGGQSDSKKTNILFSGFIPKAFNAIKTKIETFVKTFTKSTKNLNNAANNLSTAAKKEEEAAETLIVAAQELATEKRRNEYGSLQESRGLVHPNGAYKLKDIFAGTETATTGGGSGTRASGTNIYQGTGNTLGREISLVLKTQIASAASGNTEVQKSLKEAKSAVSTFLSDLLSLGIESIDLSKYDKLTKELTSEIQAKINKGDSYRSFIKTYAAAMDKSIHEINATYFEAWQKDLEKGGLAEVQLEAMEGLSFFNNGEIAGSADDWTTILGDATFVGDAEEAGILEWNAALRQFIARDQKALEEFMNAQLDTIWNFPDAIIDGAQSVTDEINDLISKAMNEGLDSKSKTRLQELLRKLGSDAELEFIRGTNGKYALTNASAKALALETATDTSTSHQITDTSRSTAEEMLSSILQGVEDSHITKEVGDLISNWLQSLGKSLADLGITETDTGYEISLNAVLTTLKTFGKDYLNEIMKIASGLDIGLLNESEINELIKSIEEVGGQDSETVIANYKDKIVTKLNEALDAVTSGFGQDNIMSATAFETMKTNFADLDIQIDPNQFEVVEGGYKASWDTITSVYNAALLKLPEAAARWLKNFSNETLSSDELRLKATLLKAAGDLLSSSETLDAITERAKTIGDILTSGFGENNVISFANVQAAQDAMKLMGIDSSKINFEANEEGATIGFDAILAYFEQIVDDTPAYAISMLSNIADNMLTKEQLTAKANALAAANANKESATALDSIIERINSIKDTIVNGISGTLSNSDVNSFKDNLRLAGISTSGLDFKETTQGLQITPEAIEALQANLTEAFNSGTIDELTFTKYTDALNDATNDFLTDLSDKISKGLQGTLSNADVTSLKEALSFYNLDGLDLQFKKTVDGLKLSSTSAITLYTALLKVDKLQSAVVFKELRASLEESNDKYKTMTSLIVNIVDLQEEINQADKYNDAKIQLYKEELALAKEIAAIRATSEDSSFNFLSQDIPGAMNNPLNYVENWSNAWNELRDATTDNKAIDFLHFYNVLGEMNNLAQASGLTLNFMGMTLDGSLEAWDAAVNKSIDALGTDADKNYGVLLSKFGDGLTGGADAFAASADGAIHTMAKAQVEILDALIQVFEVIVAMEKFEKADINANDLLDFEEIFSDTSNLENAINYTEAYTNVVNELLSKLDLNSKLYAAFEQIKVDGYTLNQIVTDAADGIKDADISSLTLAALMSALYNTLKEGDFDLSNIAESLKTWMLENTEGLSGLIDLGQFVLDFDYNVAITKNVNGTYTTPGGQTFNDFNDAVLAAVQEEIDKNENNTNTAEADAEVKVDANTEEALTNTQKLVSDINDMSATIDVNADVSNALDELSKIVDKLDEISDSTVTILVENNTSDGGSQATGNVAMAAGTRTLMGELGPELYVSDGRYHVAGENGAEFVNLPKDAIVFNHLLTQRLLSTGSTGRGRAITSEANAVALAKGGPAAANAQKTLATLKQLRAMWSRLAEASIVDLAGAVNKESSGNKNKVGSWVADVERWYNLLQKIARLEKEINYLEALRSKIEADRVPNGTEYYLSLVDSLKNLRELAATLKLLADSYNDYFETRRKELNDSPLKKFYEFNEAGQVQYKEGGLYQLASLFELDDTGKARYTPKQQYDILKSLGLGEYMLRDSNGLAIERDNDNIDLFYYDSVQAAYERMTAELQEMQDLYNNKEDAKVAYLEAITKADKLLLDIIDNQMDMELKVLDAIETREQKIIDKMTKERQALADSSAKYFEGLELALSKEREMYSRLQDQDSLTKLQRRLSILQRSGGSASEIASLQQEITDKQRDAYFEAQEAAIQEAKDASDLQLEKMQELIDLMTETLEYEKANGLLWGEVATILSGTSESIMEFITTNMPEWLAKSATALNEELHTLRNSTLQWVAYYNNGEELVQEMMGGVQESVDGLALTEAKKWNEEILKSSPLQLNYPVLDTQVAEMQALYDNNNSSTQIDKIEYNVNVKNIADAQETERLVLKAMMEGEYPWKNAFKLSPVNNSMSKGRYS